MLKGKNIIITGSNRGIGKACMEVCASFGANIFAHSRKPTEEFENLIKNLKQKYNNEIYPVYFDLTNKEEIKEGVKKINSYKVKIDALINNAGITQNKLFLMTTPEDIQQQMDVNFKSLFILSQYIAKLMARNNSGSIVNISSGSAVGDCGKSAYGASKAAVSSLTKTMAEELGSNGIRVNALAPIFIDTDMMFDLKPEIVQENINKSYLKRLGKPQEVANVAAFLCSDLSSYITGQIINVNGGIR